MLKILQSMSEFSMQRKLSSVTLSQLAFPVESNPNFPWDKFPWDSLVCFLFLLFFFLHDMQHFMLEENHKNKIEWIGMAEVRKAKSTQNGT